MLAVANLVPRFSLLLGNEARLLLRYELKLCEVKWIELIMGFLGILTKCCSVWEMTHTHTHTTYQHALIDVRGATSEVQSQSSNVLCALLVLPLEHPAAHQLLS